MGFSLERFKKLKILVVGDLMLDHYIWGDAHRISPEAPVPVVNVLRDSYTAGGAANVALNLANLKVQTSVLGYYSNDDAGNKLCTILENNKVNIIPCPSKSTAPTIIKTRVLVRNQQLCRIDRESGRNSYNVSDNDDFSYLDALLKESNAVIISDYAKGVVTQPLIDFILAAAEMRDDLLVAVDPKPSRRLNIRGAGLLTPNRSEALQLADLPETTGDEKYPLDEICRRIYELCSPKLLLITLGAGGMAICRDGKVEELLPTEAREVFDVSGAGDTVIATLTAAIASGANAHDAAMLANGAAGSVVAHMGTVPVDFDELNEWLKKHKPLQVIESAVENQ